MVIKEIEMNLNKNNMGNTTAIILDIHPKVNVGINQQPFIVAFSENVFQHGDQVEFPSGIKAFVLGPPLIWEGKSENIFIVNMIIDSEDPLMTLKPEDKYRGAIVKKTGVVYNDDGNRATKILTKKD